MWKRLKTSRTVRLAVAGILTAVGAYLAEQIDLKDMIWAVIEGLTIIFLRDAIAKNGSIA